jgi:Uncharacterized protein, similar to the N-terminal domain of Lon protease
MTIPVPLFPLNTVLFPEGILQLRIFEARYLDMVSESLRTDSSFGICLISQGREVGAPAECHDIGTLAQIIDWGRHDDGLLGITVKGGRRFRILSRQVRKNSLLEGVLEIIDDNEDEELPVEYQLFSDLLLEIAGQFNWPHPPEHEKYLDANWVCYRLAELLPLELINKQQLLEMDDPLKRLQLIQTLLQEVSIDQLNNN